MTEGIVDRMHRCREAALFCRVFAGRTEDEVAQNVRFALVSDLVPFLRQSGAISSAILVCSTSSVT